MIENKKEITESFARFLSKALKLKVKKAAIPIKSNGTPKEMEFFWNQSVLQSSEEVHRRSERKGISGEEEEEERTELIEALESTAESFDREEENQWKSRCRASEFHILIGECGVRDQEETEYPPNCTT